MSDLAFSDEILIAKIARQEVSAFETLYARHAQTVYNLSMRIVREQALAEEVLQETFWQVWRKAGEYHGGGAAAAWLYRIARNKSLDQLRRQKARPQPVATTLLDAQPDTVLPNAALAVEQQAFNDWARRKVRHALGLLPVEQRQCLEMAYFEGLSQREIADQMHMPVGTVKTRIRLGLEKLERSLRANGLVAEDVL